MPKQYKREYLNCSHIREVRMILFLLPLCLSCRKFVDIDPPASSITTATAYTNNSSAAAVMTGVYTTMIAAPAISSGYLSMSMLEGLAADELTNYYNNALFNQFYQNALSSTTSGASNNYFWKEIYQEIHVANTVLEGLAGSAGVTPAMKRQLDGEAKFIRAFYHFYAVNAYGDVPLVTTTDYKTNNTISRTPKAQVYEQIIKDLKDAQSELSVGFVDALGNNTTERIRPNRGAAQSLLSRVCLYIGDWTNAKVNADSVINNTSNYALLKDLTTVFKKNSKESIWQLPSVTTGYNTWDARYFILTAAPGTSTFPVAISKNLLSAFESNDSRFSTWLGIYKQNSTTLFYYPYKYTSYQNGTALTEYLMVFRLAEQYLIRAEANAQLGDIAGSQADLNAIRARAGLPPTTASDQASLLAAVLHERQTELFTEWGHRWFDLIRTGNINSVMGSPGNICQVKGGTWNPTWVLVPLPFSELQANSNLTQNPGYN
jgi:hypothetical protein